MPNGDPTLLAFGEIILAREPQRITNHAIPFRQRDSMLGDIGGVFGGIEF